MERKIAYGYRKEYPKENIVLEADDWTFDEWETLCKLCGLPAPRTDRIVLHLSSIECYINPNDNSDGQEPCENATEYIDKAALISYFRNRIDNDKNPYHCVFRPETVIEHIKDFPAAVIGRRMHDGK